MTDRQIAIRMIIVLWLMFMVWATGAIWFVSKYVKVVKKTQQIELELKELVN